MKRLRPPDLDIQMRFLGLYLYYKTSLTCAFTMTLTILQIISNNAFLFQNIRGNYIGTSPCYTRVIVIHSERTHRSVVFSRKLMFTLFYSLVELVKGLHFRVIFFFCLTVRVFRCLVFLFITLCNNLHQGGVF